MTSIDGVLSYYVRLVSIETKQFPHGVSLANTYKTHEEAKQFAILVDEYIAEMLGLNYESR